MKLLLFWLLTFLDALLRLFSLFECLLLRADVDVGVEVFLRLDVVVRGLDQLGAREHVRFHQAGCLLDGLGSKDSFVHSVIMLSVFGLIVFQSATCVDWLD